MTGEHAEGDEGCAKKSAYVIRTCARVLLLRIINCWPFFSKDLSPPVRRVTTAPAQAGFSILVVRAAARSQPDRGNERVLQFALDAIIALLGLNKLFRPGLCAGEEMSRSNEGIVRYPPLRVEKRTHVDPRTGWIGSLACENC